MNFCGLLCNICKQFRHQGVVYISSLEGGGYSGFQVTGQGGVNGEWGKLKKNPGLQVKPKRSPGPINEAPKNPLLNFGALQVPRRD